MFNPPDADISSSYANNYTCKSFKNHTLHLYAYYIVSVLKLKLHFKSTYCICTYSGVFTWESTAQTLSAAISNSAPPAIKHTDTELDHGPMKSCTHIYSVKCDLQ